MTAEIESEITQPRTNAELYATMFPYYLSLGCSYSEFWDAHAWIAASYYDAEIYRREQDNYNMWLQGLYFSNAINSALAMAFWDKKGAKPNGYMQHPIALTEREKAAEHERKRQEALKFFQDNQK